jgi:hypothetical protein
MDRTLKWLAWKDAQAAAEAKQRERLVFKVNVVAMVAAIVAAGAAVAALIR